jgi:hypothetical protein
MHSSNAVSGRKRRRVVSERPMGDEVMVSYCLAALDSKLGFLRGKNTRSQSAGDADLARRMAWPTHPCDAIGLVRVLRSGHVMVDETLIEVVWAKVR